MKNSKLVAKNLFKSFYQGDKTLKVLQNVNVDFEQNKSYAITGVSGSGKSTLMHLLGSLDFPDSGSVFFNDQDLFKFSSTKKDQFLNLNQFLPFE